MPISRAGMRRRIGKTPKSLKNDGGFGRSWARQNAADDPLLDGELQPLGEPHGQGAPLARWPEDPRPSPCPARSGAASRLAAATASCTAMLMPTPPIGDMACAASPMQRRPGRHHFLQPVDRDAEQLDVVPDFQFADAVGEKRRHFDDPCAERFEAFRLHPLDPAFRNDIGALPVIAAIEHDHKSARLDMAECVGAVARPCATGETTAHPSARRSPRS